MTDKKMAILAQMEELTKREFAGFYDFPKSEQTRLVKLKNRRVILNYKDGAFTICFRKHTREKGIETTLVRCSEEAMDALIRCYVGITISHNDDAQMKEQAREGGEG